MRKHNPTKNKKNQNNEQKIRKRKSYVKRTLGYEMIINNNKEDLKQKKQSFVTNRPMMKVH